MHITTHHPTETTGRSVLASLRDVVPDRGLLFSEALRIAELQAARLRELTDQASHADENAMAEEPIANLPRIRIRRQRMPTSGVSYWDGHCWIIALNARESEARQRFTLFHEYKHIIDHGRTDRLYRGNRTRSAEQQAEHAADYFAGCLLMPKRLLKRAWGNGIQTPQRLADLFEVSPRAVEVRLSQLGLAEPRERCARPISGPRGHRQQFRVAHRRSA